MDKELIFAAASMVKEMVGQKPMTTEEIVSAINTIAGGLNSIAMDTPAPDEQPTLGEGIIDPRAAIKENSITCLVCGRKMKVITKRHLESHGLTPEQYRGKYGYRKGQPLACKALTRERRKRMKGLKLWERRGKPQTEVQQ